MKCLTSLPFFFHIPFCQRDTLNVKRFYQSRRIILSMSWISGRYLERLSSYSAGLRACCKINAIAYRQYTSFLWNIFNEFYKMNCACVYSCRHLKLHQSKTNIPHKIDLSALARAISLTSYHLLSPVLTAAHHAFLNSMLHKLLKSKKLT